MTFCQICGSMISISGRCVTDHKAELSSLRTTNTMLQSRVQQLEVQLLKARTDLAQLTDAAARAASVESELRELIAQSGGVAGLHLNGEVADWQWLIEYGWLGSLR